MKKKNLKSLKLNKNTISNIEDSNSLKGGATTLCILTMAIRCGHTIGNGLDQYGNPCGVNTFQKGCLQTNELDTNGLHIC